MTNAAHNDAATAHLEHVNLTVSDIDRSARLLKDLAGWHERWRGIHPQGGETLHIGTDAEYLSLYTDGTDKSGQVKGRPMNHVGLQVNDLDAAERVVEQHGLSPFSHGTYEPGPRSFYFFDWDGIEFEVVSYD